VTEPLRYYHNITANVVNVLEAMRDSSVKQVSRGRLGTPPSEPAARTSVGTPETSPAPQCSTLCLAVSHIPPLPHLYAKGFG